MSELLYDQAFRNMEETIHDLAKLVPAPKKIKFKDHYVYRYVEKTYHQAIVQKLARYIASLRSTKLLLEHGYLQDQAALQRVMDEIQEDITFLSLGIIFNEITQWHDRYLSSFYEEEFDFKTGSPLSQDKPTVPRKKIRSFIARMQGEPESSDSMRTISKTYSGYVHAASPQIMDMYGGYPARFHVNGMLGSPIYDDHKDDIWNYFYRGIIAFAFAAKAFGKDELFDSIKEFSRIFELRQGKDYGAYGE